MRIYIFETEHSKTIIIVKELRLDLAEEIAKQHTTEDINLIEEFDSRDRDLLYISA